MGLGLTKSTVSLEAVRYDANTGLVPAIVQDATTGTVLMQAYTNREALKRTLDTGFAWFWSRSRNTYWCKGRQSGNLQQVIEVRLDCDGDSVLYLVTPAGPACHTGNTSCFYRRIVRREAVEASAWQDAGSSRESEKDNNGASPAATAASYTVLQQLWDTIADRYQERPQGSYTTLLFEAGIDKIAKKLGEEAVEIVIAAMNAAANQAIGKQELLSESADLIFHLMVLWRAAGVCTEDVLHELAQRMG